MDISDYDKFNYDYSTYWKNREYENRAEHHILNKIFANIPSGEWILDIGGSFGRLADTYSDRFKNLIILDYSLNTLQKNYKILKEKYPNIHLIAANAYHLPFSESSVDAALMVRVLHHINEQEKYLTEISKTVRSNGVYIQEFANKIHIKARIKALFKGNLKFFSQHSYQQPTSGSFEGTDKKQSIFLNYHPKYIRKLFKRADFKIVQKYGCSFLRIPFLKEKFSQKKLLKIEILLQRLFSWSNIPPSIFFLAKSTKKSAKKKYYSRIEDLFVCPKCKEELIMKEDEAYCAICGNKYYKKENIWDFRIAG